MQMRNVYIGLLVVLLGGCGQSSMAQTATTFSGMVRVTDGDSLWVGDARVRLFGIDAPETNQYCHRRDQSKTRWECGEDASKLMQQLAAGQMAVCEKRDVDRYERVVAICVVDTTDLGRAMVRAGYALAYRQYSRMYVADETMAADAAVGLWSGEFIKPWDWRRRQRGSGSNTSTATARANCTVKGNVNSRRQRIYHVPGGRFYEKVLIRPSEGDRCFQSEAAARAAGFRRSKM